jgi:hypothetical protein
MQKGAHVVRLRDLLCAQARYQQATELPPQNRRYGHLFSFSQKRISGFPWRAAWGYYPRPHFFMAKTNDSLHFFVAKTSNTLHFFRA